MAVLIRDKLLFLAHPRTGSTSVRSALLAMGGEYIHPHHAGFWDDVVQSRYRGEQVVSVVRNPYDAIVSWWCKRGMTRGMTLHDWVPSFHNGNFTRQGRLFYHAHLSDLVLYYEDDLSESFGLDVPLLNVTHNKVKPFQEYYTQAAIDAVNKRFGKEIEELGYKLWEDLKTPPNDFGPKSTNKAPMDVGPG